MLRILKDACKRAYVETGKLIGTHEGSAKISVGAGGDVSRKIDLVAESAVIETIRNAGENPTIIGEECGTLLGSNGYLIMDAVDGTTNASRGIPYCCCSLAYATAPKLDCVTEAAVIDLASGDLYHASKGAGAYLNDKKIDVRSKRDLDYNDLIGGINVSSSNEHTISSLGPLIAKLKHVRHFGANALELCYLARGMMDISADLRMKIRPTDVAGSFMIVREAGGIVLSPSGEPVDSSVFPGTTLSYVGLADMSIFEHFQEEIKYFIKQISARAGIRTRVGGVTVPHTGPDYTE